VAVVVLERVQQVLVVAAAVALGIQVLMLARVEPLTQAVVVVVQSLGQLALVVPVSSSFGTQSKKKEETNGSRSTH